MDKSKFKKYVQVLLTEAVRINNGREAYELIKSNKLGVKIDPSYKESDENIILYFDKAINNVGANNAVFATQLLANKVPVKFLSDVSDSDALKEIVSCKNKPWAKEIPGYKEAIDFSSKEKYNQAKWHNLEKSLQEEGQKHGKATKGSGNLKDVKELYNDGTWTLQVPTSWDGEKAAAFYGKKGEKQTPARWCTRTNEISYNNYTENNTKPLYVIRNWETGKSYQMAIRGNRVDLLDQSDVKGDKITKGDLSEIPDELLKKIRYGKEENMLDFKREVYNAQNEIDDYKKEKKKKISKFEKEKLEKSGYFKDISQNPKSARWGKTEKVNNEISKNIFLNFAEKSNPEIVNPLDVKGFNSSYFPDSIKELSSKSDEWNSKMIKGKKMVYGKYTKHDGLYAAKYYFNNNPNYFILMTLKNDKDVRKKDIEKRDYPYIGKFSNTKPELATNHEAYYYIYDEENNKYKKTNLAGILKNEPRAYDLLYAADNDFGSDKTFQRYVNNSESKKLYRDNVDIVKNANDILKTEIAKAAAPILKREINDTGYQIKAYIYEQPTYSKGGFIPEKFAMYATKNTGTSFELDFEKIPNTIKYKCIKFRDFDNVVKNEESLKRSLEDLINNGFMVNYSKIMLKEPKLKYLRLINKNPKDKENKLKYEEFIPNYFPY